MIKFLLDKTNNFFSYRELFKQLIYRDIKLKYRRSYLGYLWSILNPLMVMFVLLIVFSNLFKFDIPNFSLYLLSGQILFNFMVEATTLSVSSITGNGSLLKKIYVPKYIFTISKVGSSLVNLIFSFGALLIVMLFTDANFSINILFIPFILLQIFIFSLGLGLWLASISVFFRDIQYLWGVFLTMWMYLTPIFYPVSIISESYQAIYKNLNPMFSYIEQFRQIVLFSKFPETNFILLGIFFSLITLFLGTWYFNKKQDEFILYI
ncbi:ABC transporter permease [Aggregatibacter actinomycetemcomitans]|uniref:Transport permease protein n=1 Tax=Aggregatibacter actinomycetemcomitans TaxID=714 RepID=O05370_AGGAC|nr:ABC transporter permease [Aggregatibacter actinomycetemcomitans]BAA19637.1 unnamed protein product [Aggregatibacter actinomycetemcomitans Y4]AHN72720.1 hypothetical protein CF65_02643 [Aggregatibacter actinomycetemcomitans HK1651]AMQ92053.1 ABC transporter [Aggregatibacter actinomycetemcomitans]KND84190.1 ABC transporter [Aggregatibacter actinomycetemcomitans serotype b str. SCC1398]KOE53035.1 ABC transporter [Aggregatibacter actinomycetemcomitans serotype b str. I23C]